MSIILLYILNEDSFLWDTIIAPVSAVSNVVYSKLKFTQWFFLSIKDVFLDLQYVPETVANTQLHQYYGFSRQTQDKR